MGKSGQSNTPDLFDITAVTTINIECDPVSHGKALIKEEYFL
jgi:hypothetical protein